MTSVEILNKDNYHKYEDFSVFPTDQLVRFFTSIPKIKTLNILRGFEQDFILNFLDDCPSHLAEQWKMSLKFKPGSVGELMHPSPLDLNENKTIEDAIIELKKIHKDKRFTYGMIVDDTNKVTGVLVFKDVFYHEPNTALKDICFNNAICFKADDDVLQTFIKVAGKQIPEFPVIDDEGKLLGTLRGSHVNDAHGLQISAQSSIMVGASPEEGLDSSVAKCVKLRGPWLLVNLVTAFIAGAVVGIFQDTIIKLFCLPCFYPYSQVNRETRAHSHWLY